MISYFKYDNGNAFTLDGSPYSGFFHVIDDKAYTGKTTNTTTRLLSSRGNFLAEFYLNRYEFDVTYGETYKASPYILNSFDILNKSNIEQIFDKINENNLLAFKRLVIQNPNLFSITRNNTHFYGLSSTDADIRNDDVPAGKREICHIDPFSFDSEWNYLDNITSGDIVIDNNEGFIYFCSDGTTQYAISGSFVNRQPIQLISAELSDVFLIKQDTIDRKLFSVSLSSIKVYDLNEFFRCQTYTLLDEISVSISEPYKKLVKVGQNIRSEFNGSLNIKNKYSSELFETFTLSQLGLDSLISLDIREVDDFIILLGKKNGEYVFGSFDYTDFTTYTTKSIEFVSDLSELLISNIDSNVFYVLESGKVQGRLISKPTYYFGTTNEASYFYLPDYIYDQTSEYWNTIPIKYNSNSLPSNKFNNILLKSIPIETTQYLLTHNIGRIYASKLKLENTYLNSVPLNIEKSFSGVYCSESSFGLFFNTTILNLVKDTLRLYYMASEKYSLNQSNISKETLGDLSFEIQNLYLNGNESINVIAIQRILSLINLIQNELIS